MSDDVRSFTQSYRMIILESQTYNSLTYQVGELKIISCLWLCEIPISFILSFYNVIDYAVDDYINWRFPNADILDHLTKLYYYYNIISAKSVLEKRLVSRNMFFVLNIVNVKILLKI